MVNLLPEKTRRSLSFSYYLRFFTLAIFLTGLAASASAALLMPSYLRAAAEADAANRTLEASQKAVDLGTKGGAAGEFAVLSERVAIFKTYIRAPETAQVLSLVSAHIPKGVSVTKIALSPGDGGVGTVSVSGKAATRAGLLAFVSALQSVSAFEGVSIPVGSLASEINVEFTLSFSFNLSRS